jgi:drug/metabolite transporter (DMT)-like permease
MTTSRRFLPLAAAATTVLLWASAFVGIRAVGHGLSPGALALGRMLVGSLTLTAIVLVVRARRSGPPLPRGRLLGVVALWGASWFGLYNLALNAAERHLDAGTTSLLVNVAPVVVAVLAGLMLGEGFPLRLLTGMAVAFTGVVLIAATTSAGGTDVSGVLLGLLAALLYAGATVTQKRLLVRVDALTVTWLGALAGTVGLLPFLPTLLADLATAPAPAIAGTVYLGVFPTAIAFLTWGYALSRTTAGRLASATYAVPPIVVLLSWTLLDEIPAPLALAGGALCLAGVAIATRRGATVDIPKTGGCDAGSSQRTATAGTTAPPTTVLRTQTQGSGDALLRSWGGAAPVTGSVAAGRRADDVGEGRDEAAGVRPPAGVGNVGCVVAVGEEDECVIDP